MSKTRGFMVKTSDGWWVAKNGEAIVKDKVAANIFFNRQAAQEYIDGTDLWGELEIVPLRKQEN